MSSAEDAFLKDLQKQCTVDSQEYITEAREALPEISKSPVEIITKIMKSCHSLKGNVQAVGFNFCGQFVHEIETRLVEIKGRVANTKPQEIEKDLLNLEYLLSNVLQSLEKYLQELGQTLSDNQEYLKRFESNLSGLSNWSVSSSQTSSNVAESNAVVSPVATVDTSVPLKTLGESMSLTSTPSAAQPKNATKNENHNLRQTEVKEPLDEKKVFLLCRNKNRQFGIPVSKVVEVVQYKYLSLIPSPRKDLMGLMNLRGEIMPILDLKSTFGDQGVLEKSFIVICDVDGTRFGFPIEYAEQIDELNQNHFQRNENLSASSQKGLVSHIYVKGEKTVLIVDVDRIVAA